MRDYTFSVGTGDPHGLSAANDEGAIWQAVDHLRINHADDLRTGPEMVVTLMGPEGLVTRPSERLDEFVERIVPSNPAADPNRLQPGDTNAPDCNGD